MRDDFFRRLAEGRSFGGTSLMRPSLNPAAADSRIARHLAKRAVDPVQVLGHVLQHDDVPGKVGYERRAEKVRKIVRLKRRRRYFTRNGRIERGGRTLDEESNRPRDRDFTAGTQNVRWHGPCTILRIPLPYNAASSEPASL